jgi:hypothetical protein
MDRTAQLICDQVFAALVAVEVGEPSLMGGARRRTVGELAPAQCREGFDECVMRRRRWPASAPGLSLGEARPSARRATSGQACRSRWLTRPGASPIGWSATTEIERARLRCDSTR